MGKGKKAGLLCLVLAVIMLTGCSGEPPMDQALNFRSLLQGAGGCSFLAEITADLGEEICTFTLSCHYEDVLKFTVTAPESIAGISGTIEGPDGTISYDDTILAISSLAEGRLSPAAAPYALAKSWETGYIRTCGTDDRAVTMSVDTTFCDRPISLETWLDSEKNVPVYGEICYNDQRILSLSISDFEFLDALE